MQHQGLFATGRNIAMTPIYLGVYAAQDVASQDFCN